MVICHLVEIMQPSHGNNLFTRLNRIKDGATTGMRYYDRSILNKLFELIFSRESDSFELICLEVSIPNLSYDFFL